MVLGEQVVSTGLSPRYQESWGAVEALREIIQEVQDAKSRYGCRVRIFWRRGRAVIQDDGPGFGRAALALGNSSKRGDGGQIGQFGEGMKLALLVLSRSGREAVVETVGFTVRPFLAADPALGCETLHLRVRENARAKGTRFEVQATREELAQACRYFLALDPDRPRPASPDYPAIMLPGGQVYVNGVLAAEQPDLAFSYALSGETAKSLQNRDRSVVSSANLGKALEEVWRGAPTVVVESLFRTLELEERFFEHGLALRPSARTARLAARRVWGARVAQATQDPSVTAHLRDMGYSLVELPYPWRWSMSAAIPFAEDVSRRMGIGGRRVAVSDLTPEERYNLDFAREVVTRWVAPPARLVVYDRLTLDGVEIRGAWSSEKRRIALSRQALRDRATVVGVLTHEVLHQVSGALDATRDFEVAWQELATRLLLHVAGE